MPPRAHDPHSASGPPRDRRVTDCTIADVLEDPHCRALLDYLRDTSGPVDVSAASRHVVARVTGTSPCDVSESDRRRTETWLNRGFLPRLDEEGVVDVDPEAGTVRLAERTSN